MRDMTHDPGVRHHEHQASDRIDGWGMFASVPPLANQNGSGIFLIRRHLVKCSGRGLIRDSWLVRMRHFPLPLFSKVIRQPTSLLNQILGASARTPHANLRDAEDIRTLVNELSSPRLMYLMR